MTFLKEDEWEVTHIGEPESAFFRPLVQRTVHTTSRRIGYSPSNTNSSILATDKKKRSTVASVTTKNQEQRTAYVSNVSDSETDTSFSYELTVIAVVMIIGYCIINILQGIF